jgi:thioredoxin reductase (NADPH)
MPEKVIVIGSGPAGYTAAIYLSRANLTPLLYEGFQSGGMPGGQLLTTGVVENFPGFPEGIGGQQLMTNMRTQAERTGARLVMEDIVAIKIGRLEGRPLFTAVSMNATEVQANSLIIATGATAKRLPIESEKKFWGRGISACAVCDGALPIFRNKELAVIGGGDSAVEEAGHLTNFGSKVYIIHRRDSLRASKVMQQRALEHPKIEILWNRTVEEFVGDTRLNGIVLKDTKTGKLMTLPVAGAFEAIGHHPNTDFLQGQLETDVSGYLVVSPGTHRTSVEGIFAAGDVHDSKYRQAVTAAGSGCMAAIECERWICGVYC